MNHLSPEENELCLFVERKYAKSLRTTTDFDEFSLHLNKELGISLSTSTLKRLWGYVKDKRKPRGHTLDSLAVYVGFRHYNDFFQYLKTSSVYNSSFFSAVQIHVKELDAEDELAIGWAPNRYIRLRYLGNMEFEVLESRNSKLMQGDRFETITFLAGQPLSLAYILRKGERTAPFIGGRNGGLTLLKQLNDE